MDAIHSIFKSDLPFELPIWASIFGNFGPLLAAFVIVSINDGKEAAMKLLKSIFAFKVEAKFYVLAFIPLILNIVLITIYSILSQNTPEITLANVGYFLILFPFWLVMGGPLGEEVGWRGYALPILQRKYNAFTSALLLSVAWFFWHIIRYLDPNMMISDNPLSDILSFGIQVIILSIIFTYVFNKTNGSLVIVIIFHAAFNSLQYMMTVFFPNLTNDDFGEYIGIVNLLIIIFYLIWAVFASFSMLRKTKVIKLRRL